MNTKRKWMVALSAIVLAVAGGVVTSTANATVDRDIYVGEDGNCYYDVYHEPVVEHHDAIPGEWHNFSPNDEQGPFEGPPTFPEDERGTWQHMDKDIPPGHEGPDGVYQKGEGNGSWFYRQAEVPAWDEVIEEGWAEPVLTDCPVFPVPALFNADPEGATCDAPGFFDDGALGGTLVGSNEDWRDYEFENLYLSVYVGEPGQVTLFLGVVDPYTLDGLSDAWTVSDDGRYAERVIMLEDQLAADDEQCVDEPTPTPTPTPSETPSEEPTPTPTPEPTPPADNTPPPAKPADGEPSFTG